MREVERLQGRLERRQEGTGSDMVIQFYVEFSLTVGMKLVNVSFSFIHHQFSLIILNWASLM